jgi:GcrA cell cycle regulator
MIGGVSRNAVIGKAHRLKLSTNIKSRNNSYNHSARNQISEKKINISKRAKFRSLVLDKNFEEAKNLSLEELNDNTCKYMEGHPTDQASSFCGRKTVEKRSYCPLHMMMVFQFRETAKVKREETSIKEEDVPSFLQKKFKSA